MDKQILIKLSEDDKNIIKNYAKSLGLGVSTFCRMASLEKVQRVKKDLVDSPENIS